jgi:hypothetical protein
MDRKRDRTMASGFRSRKSARCIEDVRACTRLEVVRAWANTRRQQFC